MYKAEVVFRSAGIPRNPDVLGVICSFRANQSLCAGQWRALSGATSRISWLDVLSRKVERACQHSVVLSEKYFWERLPSCAEFGIKSPTPFR